MKITILTIIVLLSLATANAAQATWRVTLLPVVEYGHSINKSGLLMEASTVAKPPAIRFRRGYWVVDQISETSVVAGKAFGGELRIDTSHALSARFGVSAGLALTVLEQRVTYDISYWVQYYGYNPFTFGFDGPPILIGRADVPVQSRHVIPQLVLGSTYALTDRFSVGFTYQLGYDYGSYKNYDFYNRIYQIFHVVQREDQLGVYGLKRDRVARHSIAVELSYALSDHWSLSLRQSYIRTGDYKLSNVAEGSTTIHSLTIHIKDQTHHQTAFGVRYAF